MPDVSEVHLTPGTRADFESGLVGYLSCTYGDLRLDGLTLRRTRGGPLTVSFPTRRDHAGRDHPHIRPLSDATRRELEGQIFEALGVAP